MKYSTFEELPVWKAAAEFALRVFELTNGADFRGLGDTKNQLERAALSISNNIAEGFERGTTTELIYFLYIAKGSAGESRSMLRICEPLPRFSNPKSEISNPKSEISNFKSEISGRTSTISNFKSEISDLITHAANISKQLHGWLESLKNTEIKGTKFLTEKERDRINRQHEYDEFDREIKQRHAELIATLAKRSAASG